MKKLDNEDLKAIVHFKQIVKNYLKIWAILNPNK